MGSWKEVVYSKGLFKASDLDKPKLLTIASADVEEIGETKDQKLVVYFEEDERGCVINGERGMAVEGITGTEDFHAWLGWKVVLEKGRTKYAGKPVDCVAIRAPKQKQARPAIPVEHQPGPGADEFDDDDIPF